MKKNRSMKWVLILSFIMAVAIPMGISAVFIVRSAADTLKEEIIHKNVHLSVNLNNQIDISLSHIILTLEKLRNTIERGRVSKDKIDQELQDIVELYNTIFKIHISDRSGFVKHIAPYEEEYINFDVSNQDYFKKPVKTGKLFWSPTFISLQFGRPVVTLSVPFEGGIITGFISLNSIVKELNLQVENGFITITDQTGIFIKHPDENEVLQRGYDSNFITLSKDNKDIRIENIDIKGKKMIVFAGVIGKTNWLVTVYEYYDKMFLPVKRLYTISFINFLVIIFIIALLSIRHARKIMGEINTFGQSASVISEGNYSERIKGTKFIEFRELARQFNKMAISVEEREISIRENEERLRHILDSVGVGIFLVDPETYTITYVNPEALKILKKERNDLVGNKCMDIVCDADKKNCNVNYGIGRTITQEKELLTGDGYKIPVLKTSTMTEFSKRTIIIESFVDLRDLKAAEKDKRKLEKQLLQVQKLETIGTLAGGIAHDFNNILSPIIGYAEISLNEVKDNKNLHMYIQEIFNAAIRAKDLVMQILTFSRQGEQKLEPVKIDHILKEIMKLIRATIPSTIEIKRNIPDLDSFVLADPTQIHQIIMNLVTNSFHAMEKDGGLLTINLDERELGVDDLPDATMAAGKYIRLSITDTGSGMDSLTLSRIFEPYFSTKEVGKGTGLGLSVVHGIIKGYGGSIIAYSEPSKGSSFKVFLPVFKNKTEISQKDIKPEIPGGTEKVLVVDDDPNVLLMICKILENLGYKVSSKLKSIDALEYFKGNPEDFDLVITDMTMPKMNGLQFSEEILKIRSDIPVIICSGFSEQLTEENIRKTGIKAIIMKPVITIEIANLIRQILDSEKLM